MTDMPIVDDPDEWPFEFETGDRVVDNEVPDAQSRADRGAARVVEVVDERADEFVIEGHSETVYEANDGRHPPDAPVVEIIFESYLDGYLPGWDELMDDDPAFDEALATFCKTWGVPKRTYHYPATRLVPLDRCDFCGAARSYNVEAESWVCINDHGAGTTLGGP